ncbi:UPF0587 protein [[Candida] jaroonii]|uniref:UPF0587 protein n=1 Tax=[Candida] jaroonii TaxID=467808 RepID=A0ACA9Y650_9ASCO|nr:UPF0587 protein [[Candida] jaroonii]
MRTTLVKLQADLENCTDLKPLDHEEYPHDYGFKFICNKCRYEHPKEIIINRFDRIAVQLKSQIKRTANFFTYCKDCHNEIFIIITLAEPVTAESKDTEDEDNFIPIIEVHSHGCRIKEFILEDQFQCTSSAGNIIEGVDLRANDWSEFDEEGNIPVTITNAKFQLEELPGNGQVTTL